MQFKSATHGPRPGLKQGPLYLKSRKMGRTLGNAQPTKTKNLFSVSLKPSPVLLVSGVTY